MSKKQFEPSAPDWTIQVPIEGVNCAGGNIMAHHWNVNVRQDKVNLVLAYRQAYTPGKPYVERENVQWKYGYKTILCASFAQGMLRIYNRTKGIRDVTAHVGAYASVYVEFNRSRHGGMVMPPPVDFYYAVLALAKRHGFEPTVPVVLPEDDWDRQWMVNALYAESIHSIAYPIARDLNLQYFVPVPRAARDWRTPADYVQYHFGTRNKRVVRAATRNIPLWLSKALRDCLPNDDQFANALESVVSDRLSMTATFGEHDVPYYEAMLYACRLYPAHRLPRLVATGELRSTIFDLSRWHQQYGDRLPLDAGRNFREIHDAWFRIIERERRAMYALDTAERQARRAAEMEQPFPYDDAIRKLDGTDIGGGLIFKLFTNGRELQSVSDIMDNCISSYWRAAATGSCQLYWIEKNGEMYVNIEVRDGRMVQCYKSYNRSLDSDEYQFISAFLRKHKITRR